MGRRGDSGLSRADKVLGVRVRKVIYGLPTVSRFTGLRPRWTWRTSYSMTGCRKSSKTVMNALNRMVLY